MDSQENALTQGEQQEVKVEAAVAQSEVAAEASQVEETMEAPQMEVAADEAPVTEHKVYETKAEVLERIREIAHGDETPQKEEVDYLKTVF